MTRMTPPAPPPPLAIHLFGPRLRVLVHGEPLPRPRTRSVEWLLALLVLRHGRTVDRSWLAGTLWIDSRETQALKNLRNDLTQLRTALGVEGERIQSPTRDTLTLDLSGVEVDVLRFDTATQAGDEESLRTAVDLYAGPLLAGCDAAWVLPDRESREQACLMALERLAEAAQARDDFAGALAFLRRAGGLDPLSDPVQRQKMRTLAASGDTPAALIAYREHRLRLLSEMNVEPDEETTRLFQQIRARAQQQARRPRARPLAPATGGAAAATPRSTPSSALPHPLTYLIGREREVHDVAERLAASRLVTLVGAGGVGKTRLAIEVARTVTEDFADGALFVPLAALSDPALLPAFLAAALGLREETAPEPVEALVGWLSGRMVLLVLDNCEHLVEAAAQLTQALLERCPSLRILATSRQRLGLTGEVVCRVPSLPVPDLQELERLRDKDSEQEQDPELSVRQYPAAQLFLERAAMAAPEFRLAGREEAMAVAQICQRLDGIPLAIELAAARIGLLSVTQIAARLDDRFRLLTGGSRAVLPRHQTLRALIDWSFDQLTPQEQGLLCRLSVFAGGWRLEAVEAIGGDLDLLASLNDRSLVLAEKQEAQGAGVRYRMLETVREYGREKLREHGDEAAARNQHLAYCLALAEAAEPDLRGPSAEAALHLLESEIGNVRAALAWAQSGAAAPSDASLRLASALWPFWEVRGYHSEGREHLRAALGRPDLADAPEGGQRKAQALLGAAALAFVQADLKATLDFGRQSLALFRHRNEPRSLAEALILCGHACLESGEASEAASLLQEALDCCRQCDWTRGRALALTHLGLVAMQQQKAPDRARSLLDQGLSAAEAAGHAPTLALALHNRGLLETGDYSSTVTLLEKSLEIWRRLGHGHKASLTLRHLGWMARRQGDLARALSYFEEAVAACREQSNRFHLAFGLLELGSVYYEQRDYTAARPVYAESLELFTQIGDEWGSNGARMNLGSTLFQLGEYAWARELHQKALAFYQTTESVDGITWSLERLAVVEAVLVETNQAEASKAARLLGAASSGREAWGKPLDRWDRADWDRAVAAVRAALGGETFDAAFSAGRALSRAEGIALALDDA